MREGLYSVFLHYSSEDLSLYPGEQKVVPPLPSKSTLNFNLLLERITKGDYSGSRKDLLYFSIALFYRFHLTWEELFYGAADFIMLDMVNLKGLSSASIDILSFLTSWKENFPEEFLQKERKMYWETLCWNLTRFTLQQGSLPEEEEEEKVVILNSYLKSPTFTTTPPTRPSQTALVYTNQDSNDALSPPTTTTTTFQPNPTVIDYQSIIEFEPIEIANQLTTHERHLYSRIRPVEFLRTAWTRKDRQRLAPNIVALIEWSNRVSWTLIQEILTPEKAKLRAAVLRHLVQVALELERLRNYNALKCVITSINYSMVKRLGRTMQYLKSSEIKSIHNLESLTSEERNWAALRQAETLGCLPFLGVHLTDLVHLNERIKNQNDQAITNQTVDSWVSFADCLKSLLKLLPSPLANGKDDDNPKVVEKSPVITFFINYGIMEEKDLISRSLKLEPRIV